MLSTLLQPTEARPCGSSAVPFSWDLARPRCCIQFTSCKQRDTRAGVHER
jgi:hypothetical protein